MTKSLDTVDHLAKIALALSVIVFYALGIIKGPFAIALLTLACLTIVIFVVRLAFRWITTD